MSVSVCIFVWIRGVVVVVDCLLCFALLCFALLCFALIW